MPSALLALPLFRLRNNYQSDVASRLIANGVDRHVTEADLARLPALVQHYLRTVGVVGQPRVRNFKAHIHGRIRDGQGGRWMPFTAEQHNFFNPSSRFFYLNASMFFVPVQGYHRFVDASATMEIRLAGMLPIVNALGPELTQSETVTMFNDMCLMAPATLIDAPVRWSAIDHTTVAAEFVNAGYTVHARLCFDTTGQLTNFISDDRYQMTKETGMRRLPWSTPITDYRRFGTIRLASRGEGRWHEPGGAYAYIQLTIDDVEYNVAPR